MWIRRTLLAAALCAGIAPVLAQGTWPSKPIRIVRGGQWSRRRCMCYRCREQRKAAVIYCVVPPELGEDAFLRLVGRDGPAA